MTTHSGERVRNQPAVQTNERTCDINLSSAEGGVRPDHEVAHDHVLGHEVGGAGRLEDQTAAVALEHVGDGAAGVVRGAPGALLLRGAAQAVHVILAVRNSCRNSKIGKVKVWSDLSHVAQHTIQSANAPGQDVSE